MSKVCWTYIISMGLVLLAGAQADLYPSSSQLEQFLKLEVIMAEHFGVYLKRMEEKQQRIKDFLAKVDKVQKSIHTDVLYYENPLNGFITIYRMVHSWRQEVFDNVFVNDDFKEYEQALADALDSSSNFNEPSSDDLQDAVLALARLQDTYKLPTAELANGQIMGVKYASSINLTASDCFVVGSQLFEQKQYAYAVEWLLQAKLRNAHAKRLPHVSNIKILEYLSTALFATGHYKLAYKLNQQLLQMEPNNKLAKQNEQGYARKVAHQRSMNPIVRDASKPPAVANKTVLFERYQRVCRGELRQAPQHQRQLHCRYTENGVAYRRLAPFKLEQMSLDPFVAYYHDVIHDSEMQRLMAHGNQYVVRSLAGNHNDSRTSNSIRLHYEQHAWLASLKLRLEHITGLSMESAEPLQLLNYGIGGQSEPHYDFFENNDQMCHENGNRILTALFHLNDVELGGGTAFPYLQLLVPVIKGSLLVWHNSHESLHNDYRTVHAGCPVLKGNKWICNEWFHEAAQELKRPCGLTLDSHKSMAYKD